MSSSSTLSATLNSQCFPSEHLGQPFVTPALPELKTASMALLQTVMPPALTHDVPRTILSTSQILLPGSANITTVRDCRRYCRGAYARLLPSGRTALCYACIFPMIKQPRVNSGMLFRRLPEIRQPGPEWRFLSICICQDLHEKGCVH